MGVFKMDTGSLDYSSYVDFYMAPSIHCFRWGGGQYANM